MILLSRKERRSPATNRLRLGDVYFWLYGVLVIFNTVLCLPNGSPLCEINAEKLSGCMGGDNNPSYNYSLHCGDCLVKQGELLPIKLSAAVPFYKGLLLYVQGGDLKDRVGEFTIDTSIFKENSLKCKKFLLEKPNSVLTHKSNAEKPTDTTFFWRAPVKCAGSSFTINSAFIYDQLSHWQVLDPIKVTCQSDLPVQQGASSSSPTPLIQTTISKDQTSLIEEFISKFPFTISSLNQLYKYLIYGTKKRIPQRIPLKANVMPSSEILPDITSYDPPPNRHNTKLYDKDLPP